MKSTNRQIHLGIDQTKNYLKMCLLNCILISIVTLTQSLPVLPNVQSTQMTLSSAIAEHPKFQGTLLNPAIVPFVNGCKTDKLAGKQKILCGPYFEMIKKLDDSNVNGLTTAEDFASAMSVYNQTKIGDFCAKFPSLIPNDQKQYPESYKLYKYVTVTNYCPLLCADQTDFENVVAIPMCRVFAIGYQLSDTKSPVQQINAAIKDTTTNQVPAQQPAEQPAERPGESFPIQSNDEQDTAANMESTSDKKGQETPQAPKTVLNDVRKEVVAETFPRESVNGFGGFDLKENASPVAESAAEVLLPKIEASDAKLIAPTSYVKANSTQTMKSSEQKPTEKKVLPPNDVPMIDVQTAEKPASNPEQPLLDPDNEDDVVKDDEDKTKGVSEDNDNFDDSGMNSKDKLVNMNGDDSIEANENNDEEMIESEVQPAKPFPDQSSVKSFADQSPAKSFPDQSPDNDQLHNEEDPFTDDTDSNFFTYFMFLLLVCVIAYVVYHNKSKMLALMLEGRRTSSTNGRSGLSRRKHTAAYRKLDSNLEEAITSSANGRSTQVIY